MPMARPFSGGVWQAVWGTEGHTVTFSQDGTYQWLAPDNTRWQGTWTLGKGILYVTDWRAGEPRLRRSWKVQLVRTASGWKGEVSGDYHVALHLKRLPRAELLKAPKE